MDLQIRSFCIDQSACRRNAEQSKRIALTVLALFVASSASAQQLDPLTQWAATVSYEAQVSSNIIYQKAGTESLRLDVITVGQRDVIRPVVIFFHGGGWVNGSKESVVLKGLPYLARGMDVVNVEYRVASQALAPAAVEDCRCALHWVAWHAKEYGFDSARIVVAGESAGGHLALMTGMLEVAAGFDRECELPSTQFRPGLPDQWSTGSVSEVKVAAIIDLFGVTDVSDLLRPPNRRNHAVRWLGDVSNSVELARRLSPVNYAHRNSPPILIIHGDQDPVIPYEQAVRLHEALEHVGAPNQLTTIRGGGHGATSPFAWTDEQNLQAQGAVFTFLDKFGILQH